MIYVYVYFNFQNGKLYDFSWYHPNTEIDCFLFLVTFTRLLFLIILISAIHGIYQFVSFQCFEEHY